MALRAGSMWGWISKVPSEHFGYGICIAGKVLPVPDNLSSYIIGFIEFTFKVGFHRSNLRKEALANTLMEMGPTDQSDSRFPFTVFNVLTLGMIDYKRRIETFLRRSYIF